MKRRSFLTRLAGFAGALCVAGKCGAKVPNWAEDVSTQIRRGKPGNPKWLEMTITAGEDIQKGDLIEFRPTNVPIGYKCSEPSRLVGVSMDDAKRHFVFTMVVNSGYETVPVNAS